MRELMKLIVSKKIIILVSALCAFPIILIHEREAFLSFVARSINVDVVTPGEVSPITCNSNFCWKDYRYNNSLKSAYIGFYGFNAESCVFESSDSSCKPHEFSKIQADFYKFHVTPVNQIGGFTIRSFNILNTPRLGSQSPSIFLGSKSKIENLRSLYELLSVHLYLFQALLFFVVPILVISSQVTKNSRIKRDILFLGISGAISQVIFSHYLSSLLFSFGFTFEHFLAICRISFLLFYGYFVLRPLSLRLCLVLALSYFFLSVFNWPYQGEFISYSYRWGILLLFGYSVVRNLYLRSLKDILFQIAILHDLALLFNLPGTNGKTAIVPISMFLPFILECEPHLTRLALNNIFAMKKRVLENRLKIIRQNAACSKLDVLELSKSCLHLLFESNFSNQVAMCILYENRPINLVLNNAGLTLYNDGDIPPVFARVMQTGDSYWMAGDDEFDKLRSNKFTGPPRKYKQKTLSCVVPVKYKHVTYGAIAITDIHSAVGIDDEIIEHVISSISEVLISALTMSIHEDSEKLQLDLFALRKSILAACSVTSDFSAALRASVDTLASSQGKKGILYKVNEDKSLCVLHITPNFNLALRKRWLEVPFVMRNENKLGPIPVAYNEKHEVIIPNISSYYGLLSEMSVALLRESETTGLYVFPLIFGTVEYMVVMMDAESKKCMYREPMQVLVDVASFYFEQCEVKAELSKSDSFISKFATAPLLAAIKKYDETERILIGETINCSFILFDVRGSTLGSTYFDNPEELARRYANVYADVAELALDVDARFEKSNGDGMVLTLRGEIFETQIPSVKLLVMAYKGVLDIALNKLFASDVMAVLHHGTVFQGVFGNCQRIGWENHGRDLNLAFEIEKCAKKIPGTKFAISYHFQPILKKIFSTDELTALFKAHKVGSIDVSFYALDSCAVDRLLSIDLEQLMLDQKVA